jgi:hypothetical protein
MAEVKYTTQLGTEIILRNVQSNSSFEILKAAVPLIEQVELAEKAGKAEELIGRGLFASVGSSARLVLAGNPIEMVEGLSAQPDDLEDDDEDDLVALLYEGNVIEVIEALTDQECDNDDCPIHGDSGILDQYFADENDELTDEQVMKMVADALEEISCPECAAEREIKLIHDAYDDLDELIARFVAVLEDLPMENIPQYIKFFGADVSKLAEKIDPACSAAGSILGIGTGLKMAIDLFTHGVLAAEERKKQALKDAA